MAEPDSGMRTRLLAYLAVPLVVIAVPARAQRPALSGTWVYAPADTPATLPKAPSPVFGTRFDLKLDGATATLTRPAREGSFTAVLPTEGSRVTSPIAGRLCEGESKFHESAAWEGDALVFTVLGTTPAGGGTTTEFKNRRIVRMVSPDMLVVEGTMVQQGQGRQVGAVYRRTTEPMPAPRAALPVKGIAATISDVAWIGTTWIGTTGTTTTEERWTPPASGGLIGLARTLRNGTALASFEFLCIAERDGTLVYNAMPDARMPATMFVLTELTPTSATFSNPTHDYPQSVRYALTADGALETTIAGANGARARSVTFKKP
jgi:hypothetical protein